MTQRQRHPYRRAGVVLSLLLHGAMFALLIDWALNAAQPDGGGGWAESIGITADGGYQGRDGNEQRNASGAQSSADDDIFRVTMMRMPPRIEPPKNVDVGERQIVEAPNMENRIVADVPEAIPIIPRTETEAPQPLLPPDDAEETSASPSDDASDDLAAGDEAGDPSAGGNAVVAGGANGTDAGSGGGEGRTRGPRLGDFLPGPELQDALIGFTIIGTEGFYDGSTPDNEATRTTFEWQAYYDPSGEIEARFIRPAAEVHHGPIAPRRFYESGTWEVSGNLLCQRIEKVGYGTRICFEVHRKGNEIAMYYAECGALSRCYRGRLGPTGIIVRGRAFREFTD